MSVNNQNQDGLNGQNLNNQGPVPQPSGCNGQEPARRCHGSGEDKQVSEFGERQTPNSQNDQNQDGQNLSNQSPDQTPGSNGQEPARRWPSSGEEKSLREFGYRNDHDRTILCQVWGEEKPHREFGYRFMDKGFIR